MKARKHAVTVLRGISLAVALSLAPAATLWADPPPAAVPSTPSMANLQAAYGHLPLSFEANDGQMDRSVKFLSRGQGYHLFLTSTEAVLALQQPTKQPGGKGRDGEGTERIWQTARTSDVEASSQTTLRMQLVGANADPQVQGEDVLPGTANYFIGKDSTHWRSNVPTYAKVRYRDVYAGIDMVYYGNQQQLEFDFVVAPGADPASIRLAIAGADTLTVEANDLVVHTKGGEIRLHQPAVYQNMHGVQQAVAGRYVLVPRSKGEGQNTAAYEVGFQVAAYDASKPLVIDPVLSYATYLGGSSVDYANYGMAVDTAGNVYVAGLTASSNFPATVGVVQNANGGGAHDVFVAKLNPTGTALVYATYVGGSGDDGGYGLAIDAIGNVYVAGNTNSSNFPTTPGVVQPAHGGGWDAFAFKLNRTGAALAYATYLGGSGDDFSNGDGVAIDTAGNAYVIGDSYASDFPTTVGVVQKAFGGGSSDAFVAKLNPTGTALLYATYLGGGDFESGIGIAVDAAGNAYATGTSRSTDFPTTTGAYQTTYAGGLGTVFVSKLNPSGTNLEYSTYLGGSGTSAGGSVGTNMVVDAARNAYVAGFTEESDFPVTSGVYQQAWGGSADGFVAKLNPTGSALLYATYLGGGGYDIATSVAIDGAGNAYISGQNGSTNFPNTAGINGVIQSVSGGGIDAFVAKLNPTGTSLIYATYLGGTLDDYTQGLAIDAAGTIYIAGLTRSTDFPVTAGVIQHTYGGDNDAFVAKISNGNLVCSTAQANPASLWEPKHQFVPITIGGVTNPDGNPLTFTVLGVRQDEPVRSLGTGNTGPDAVIQGGSAAVRAERDGNGNGRVYHLAFKAEDGQGSACAGEVTVGVPLSMAKGLTAIDGGPLYDSTIP